MTVRQMHRECNLRRRRLRDSGWRRWSIQELEVLDRNLAVEHGSVESCFTRWQDDHEVRVCREFEDEETEAHACLVLHANELFSVARCSCEA